ncbi:MAG TPA: cyclic nucleotide-binding domain-containing protein [Jatrophihabitantaceae bacterium]|nr:cyclic nucleotide-binding domain-containing protein [Jatrophihabitantaceae bacterium]
MGTDELQSIPLFKNLTDGQRERVAERLQEVEVDLGAVIARQGAFAYHLFVVREGTAVVTIDGELVGSLGPGSTFGEIGVLDHGRRTANVVAATPMRLLTMMVWDFDELAAELPEFAAQVKTTAQHRLERT